MRGEHCWCKPLCASQTAGFPAMSMAGRHLRSLCRLEMHSSIAPHASPLLATSGANSNGELGDGTKNWRPTPTRVATDLVFVDINAGSQHACGLLANLSYACWGEGPPPVRALGFSCCQTALFVMIPAGLQLH